MIDTAYHESDPENRHQAEKKCDGKEVDRLIDGAAMQFARLFLDHCMYMKQQGYRGIQNTEHDAQK